MLRSVRSLPLLPASPSFVVTVGLGFVWYPWAVDLSARWLDRLERLHAPADTITATRRVLGHLVGAIDASIRDIADKETWIASETLYAASTVHEDKGHVHEP